MKSPPVNTQHPTMAVGQSNCLTECWSDVKALVMMHWTRDRTGTVLVMKTQGTQTAYDGQELVFEFYALWNDRPAFRKFSVITADVQDKSA